MRPTHREFANPREWLTRLADESDGYRHLVRESGGTARAAFRLARAQCSATHGAEPCLADLQAAATLLASKLGSGGMLPIQSLLPSAPSTPPAPGSLPPSNSKAATRVKAAPSTTSAPPAPSSAERRAASKSRSRQSAPALRADS